MHRFTNAKTGTGVLARCTGRIVALLAVITVSGLFIMGCGGSHTTFASSSTDGTPGGFTGSGVGGSNTKASSFVGAETCKSCHASIHAEYLTQAHGQNFHTAHGQDLINGTGGACAACHVTGFGETTGWKSDGSTPQLEGISCEECHGPGSQHVAKPSKSNINLVPDSSNTCWDCHVSSYKLVKSNPGAITDTSLKGKAPSKAMAHHPQATFLLGTQGYNRTGQPGPHAFVDNTCTSCHIKMTNKDADGHLKHDPAELQGNIATCQACHSDPATKMINFQKAITASLIELGGEDPANAGEPDPAGAGGLLGAYATAHSISLNTNTAPTDPAVKAYKASIYNYSYVLADNSKGVHNPKYAEELIGDAKGYLANGLP